MATIGSLGVGAGIDLNNVLSQMMEIQRRPLVQLQDQQRNIRAQISDYGTLKSAISIFKDAVDKLKEPDAFSTLKAASSNESAFTATVSDGAAAGNHAIEVLGLASAHKLATTRYADSATAVGNGTLQFSVNGESMNLAVNATNNTLAGLRDAINSAADNPGITASIINESGGSRLILSSNETGLANAINVTVTDADDGTLGDFSGLSRLFDVGNGTDDEFSRQVTAAADASVKFDGFTLTSSTNTFEGAVDGLTLTAKEVGTGSLNLARDDEQLTKLVQGMVDAYNTLTNKISSLRDGNLRTDSTLRQIENSLLNELSQSANLTGMANLFQVGVTRDRFGTMQFDSSKLTEALAADPSQVSALFSNETQGFAVRLSSLAENMMAFDGILKAREEGLNSRLESLQDAEARMEYRLGEVESRLKKQFSALDTTMSRLNSTGAYLSSQLASMMR